MHINFPFFCLKYLDRRCIEADKCKKIKNKLSITRESQEIYWKPIKRECLPHCPVGYAENKQNKHECRPCQGQCPKSKCSVFFFLNIALFSNSFITLIIYIFPMHIYKIAHSLFYPEFKDTQNLIAMILLL